MMILLENHASGDYAPWEDEEDEAGGWPKSHGVPSLNWLLQYHSNHSLWLFNIANIAMEHGPLIDHL
jgi:hypothetical protein